MSYQTILVHVDASQRTLERIKLAANMAISGNAHLVGTAATGISELFYMPGAVGESTVQLGDFLDFLEERASNALVAFESTAQKMGVSSFEKRVTNDEAGVGISMEARYSDLVVIGQHAPDDPSPALMSDFPEYVVMHSGRPVLIIPNVGQFDGVGKKVIIAWDASMEAARAVTAAIPLLQQAQAVQIVIFNSSQDSKAHGELPGADIALYLARHDIKVEVLQQTTTALIGEALLSHAVDCGADLIVMGCYAHSRFREVLLGGVTHTILKSMSIPVLMAH